MKQELFKSSADPAHRTAEGTAEATLGGTALCERSLLIDEYTPLVRRIAWQVHGRMSKVIDVEDLIQIGLMALIEAGRTFEDRGIDFKHYASVRVRGAMIDGLRREARMSRGNMINWRRLNAARRTLESQTGGAVSDKELAGAVGMAMPDYHSLIAVTAAERVESLDHVYSDHAIWFADRSDSADILIEKEQLMTELNSNMDELTDKEALVVRLYFVEDMTLEDIGLAMGVGAARVCQIKKSALKKLKAKMAP